MNVLPPSVSVSGPLADAVQDVATALTPPLPQHSSPRPAIDRAIAAWASGIAAILGLATVAGLSFKSGAIDALSAAAKEDFMQSAQRALALAAVGLFIALLANGIVNQEGVSNMAEPGFLDRIRAYWSVNKFKVLALGLSIACVVAATFFAFEAIDISLTGDLRPITEGNYLLSVNAEGTPNTTYCGMLETDVGGAVFFRPDGGSGATPVAEFGKLTIAGGC